MSSRYIIIDQDRVNNVKVELLYDAVEHVYRIAQEGEEYTSQAGQMRLLEPKFASREDAKRAFAERLAYLEH